MNPAHVALVVHVVNTATRNEMFNFNIIGTVRADEPQFRLSTREGTIFEDDIQDAIRWARTILEINIETGTSLEFTIRYY